MMMATKSKSSQQDIDAIAESLLEKQHDYFEPRLAQIQLDFSYVDFA